MKFHEALEAMENGAICKMGGCLYQVRSEQLMVQVTSRQAWAICHVMPSVLIRGDWSLHARKEEEVYERRVINRAGIYVVEVGPTNHVSLAQCIENVAFAGFVYELPEKQVISGSPMLFSRGASFNASHTADDEERKVLRPVAARFRRD